ncbi:MAG: sulfur carrier protein ThiS [Endomicrobium sp.]|jgi:thiamine biosynthesis protein ThiS|nr:sulfur carrier protein ThiS [Endomicrobium sp.]
MITIKVNGKNKEIEENESLSNFLKTNGINFDEVTIEHNFKIVDFINIANIILKKGDVLEILRFVGGG